MRRLLAPLLLILLAFVQTASAQEVPKSIDQRIDDLIEPVADMLMSVVFFSIPVGADMSIPIVLILLAGTALFLTVYFGFVNCRLLGVSVRTIRGRYSSPGDPGQITHFQALATALSATVGLGNIAGVAIAIGLGGPGAVLWMVLMGFFGMTSKFCECTLGVRYRRIDKDGTVHGGAMYYLSRGLRERGLEGLGSVLAALFAIFCIGGALGAGNMFQINQSKELFNETFGLFSDHGWIFGLLVAIALGAVIIGGIVWIARVTQFLVPFMCILYLLASATVILVNIADVPAAFRTILDSAFSGEAAAGGAVGALIVGIQRAVFSNEAGVGSAPIAHSSVKTRKPASEGLVALLEPFIDTVLVCTATALVIVLTGFGTVNARVGNSPLAVHDQIGSSTASSTIEAGTMVTLDGTAWCLVQEEAEGSEGWARIGGFQGLVKSQAIAAGPESWTYADATVPFLPQPGAEEPEPVDPRELRILEAWFSLVPKDGRDILHFRLLPEEEFPMVQGSNLGIWRTSQAFRSTIPWFPPLFCFIVLLFAFSTMISWSYYGEQALGFLTGNNPAIAKGFRLLFCAVIVLGSAGTLGNVLNISDALFFCMVAPNLIGVYLMLPVVKEEVASYLEHCARIDSKRG